MPLSNDEERTLDEIERAIHDDDPEFAATVSFERHRRHRHHQELVAGVASVLGISVMMIGLVAPRDLLAVSVVVNVAGFLTMVASAGWLSLRQGHF